MTSTLWLLGLSQACCSNPQVCGLSVVSLWLCLVWGKSATCSALETPSVSFKTCVYFRRAEGSGAWWSGGVGHVWCLRSLQ